jgi:hypothetical protein
LKATTTSPTIHRRPDRLLSGGADYVQVAVTRRPPSARRGGASAFGSTDGLRLLIRWFPTRRTSRIFRADLLRDPKVDMEQAWLDSYDLEPYVLYKAIRLGYRIVEHPVTVRYNAREGYTKMRGLRDWWRLFRPAVLLRFGVKR